MKIGPLTIARNAAPTRRPAPEFAERGATGTLIFGGWMQSQDYNPDLQAPACYDVYDKMRLGDGTVRAILNLLKLPILRAHWEVEPASDSAQDHMIADFIEKDLHSMTSSYISFLRQALLMFDYGSMLFEKVWYLGDDGLIHLRKLAPRLPKTIQRWMTDENGGFAGVWQGAIKASGYELVTIPQEKLILFVNEQEGANFRGVSMLRGAYKHWYYKDGYYRIDAIGNEKRTVGVDIGTIKAGASNKDDIKTGLERALMTLHGHDKQFIVEDEENFTYRLETGGSRGAANAIMASIEHHDLLILRSVAAEFAAMGSGSTGSLAMHKDKSAFFLMSLEASSDTIAETQTAHLLRPWVDYNWTVKEYPRIKYSRLDTRELGVLAKAINDLMSVGALTPDPQIEAELRALADLPAQIQGVPTNPDVVTTTEETAPTPIPRTVPKKVAAAIRTIQERQLARVQTEMAAGKALDAIDVPYRREVAESIAEVLRDAGAEPEMATRKGRALANLLADRLKADLAVSESGVIRRGLAAVA